MRYACWGTAIKNNRRRLYLEDFTRKGSCWRDVIKCLLLLTLVIFPLCYSTLSLSLFVRLTAPPSLPTKTGWNKQTDRPIPKAGIIHFSFCRLATGVPKLLLWIVFQIFPYAFIFCFRFLPLPLSSRWFSVWHCRSHSGDAVLSYFT